MSFSIQKIVFFGDSKVGVTALCDTSFGKKHNFAAAKTTIGCDFLTKDLEINGRTINVQGWDIAMDERFRGLNPYIVFRGADAVVMCYDTTNKASFEHLKDHLQTADEQAPNALKYIVGTKTDLYGQREVEYKEAEAFAKLNQCQVIETSAKNNSDTTVHLVNDIATAVLKKQSSEQLLDDDLNEQPAEQPADAASEPLLMNSTFESSRNRAIKKRMFLFGAGSAVTLAAAGVLFAIGAGAIRSRIGIHGYWMGGLAAITSLGLLYLVNSSRKKLNSNNVIMD